MSKVSTSYLGVLWVAALLAVHVEGRVLASPQQGTKEPPIPVPTMTSSKDCGTPYARCGGSIPDGIKCPNGPGWCQKGYFCGYGKVPLQKAANEPAGTLFCLPVPENCGTLGNECCPSNTVTPHTQDKDVFRPPYCADGLVCFSRSQHGNQDMYQGNEGSYTCMLEPKDCGTAGKSCCITDQMTWRISTNPEDVKTRSNARKKPCDGDLVCKGLEVADSKIKFINTLKLGTCG